MATGFEVKAYNDLSTIAMELQKIRKLLDRLVDQVTKGDGEDDAGGVRPLRPQ